MSYEKLEQFLSDLEQTVQVGVELYEPNADFPNGFLKVDKWRDISLIHEHWNRLYHPEIWQEWAPYYQEDIQNPQYRFSDLRVSFFDEPLPMSNPLAKPPYCVPEGLEDLDGLIDWDFSDSSNICIVCGPIKQDKFSVFIDGDNYCATHVDKEDYLESRLNQPRLTIDLSVLESPDGWSEVPIEFENGMYGGQTDSPSAVLNILEQAAIDAFFTQTTDPFQTEFSVWVQNDRLAEVTVMLNTAHQSGDLSQGYDIAEEFKKIAKGGTSPYIKVWEVNRDYD